MDKTLLFSGTAHVEFAQELAQFLKVSLGKVYFEPFPDGEISIQIGENVRGRECFVVQSIAGDPNYALMELLIMMDALKRASASGITAVIPYFGYSRQDRKDKPRVPITAKLVANLLVTAGATRVLTMDLHAGQIQGFFDVPVDNLYARPVLADEIAKQKFSNLVIMAPDLGAIKIARAYANHLNAEFAVMDKRRVSTEEVEISAIIGVDVRKRDVLIVDDMCSTGGTLIKAAEVCKNEGAGRIFAAFTHGLLVKDAIEKFEKSDIEKIFCSNTVVLPKAKKFVPVSVSQLFGEAIKRICSADSISSIFN
ncbi:MAG: ribose-phosphate diphosphokinase [Chlamydiales bacterium]